MTTTDPGPALTPDALRAIPDLRERFDAVDPARQAHLDTIAELATIPREIVAELLEQGLSHGAVGKMLGITRQRVQQLSMSPEAVAAAEARGKALAQERARERAQQREAEHKRLRTRVARLRAQGKTHAEVAYAVGISKPRAQTLAKEAKELELAAEVDAGEDSEVHGAA